MSNKITYYAIVGRGATLITRSACSVALSMTTARKMRPCVGT